MIQAFDLTSSSRTQAAVAYERIEEMIITLELAPGTRISEATMSEHLGIGRTPVREAMRLLAREGYLRILPRAGAIVSDIDVTDQFKLIELRRQLERYLTVRAAQLADDAAKMAFIDLAHRFEAAVEENEGSIFMDADREFNALIVNTADNKYATAAMGPIQAQTRRFWYLNFNKFGELDKVSPTHAKIAAAVARNDETGAAEAFDELMDYVEDYTRRTVRALF